jgi:hypothetical protein
VCIDTSVSTPIKYACSRCLKTWTIKNVEFGLTGSRKEFSRCEHLSA